MATATTIADWVIRYRADIGVPIDPVSLQKMLFYAQAFHLARHGEPLFPEQFEAWKHGPVVPQVWRRFRDGEARVIMPDERRLPPQIDAEIESELRDVVDFFSRYNPFTLAAATHQEEPWREARGDRLWHEPSDEPIPTERIRSYYAALLEDGENALSRHEILDIVPEPRLGIFYQAGICVRRMTRHPFYRMDWTEALSSPIRKEPRLPKRLFAPIRQRDFVGASEL